MSIFFFSLKDRYTKTRDMSLSRCVFTVANCSNYGQRRSTTKKRWRRRGWEQTDTDRQTPRDKQRKVKKIYRQERRQDKRRREEETERRREKRGEKRDEKKNEIDFFFGLGSADAIRFSCQDQILKKMFVEIFNWSDLLREEEEKESVRTR